MEKFQVDISVRYEGNTADGGILAPTIQTPLTVSLHSSFLLHSLPCLKTCVSVDMRPNVDKRTEFSFKGTEFYVW